MLEERRAYLTHLANQGYGRDPCGDARRSLCDRETAWGGQFGLERPVTLDEVKRKIAGHRRFILICRPMASSSSGVYNSDPFRSLPTRRRSKRSPTTWSGKGAITQTIHQSLLVHHAISQSTARKEGSLHKITPSQIDRPFGSCSIQEVIRG